MDDLRAVAGPQAVLIILELDLREEQQHTAVPAQLVRSGRKVAHADLT